MAVNTSIKFGAYWYVGSVPDAYFRYGSNFGGAGEFNSGLPGFDIPRPDGGFVPPPDSLDLLLQRGVTAMMPKIKSELSLVNSLIELKDFLTLRGTIESVKEIVMTKFTLRHGLPLRDLFRAKSDVYLQYRFNIAPLLSDISGIYRSLTRVERRVNDFVSRSGRPRTSHFEMRLSESSENASEVVQCLPVDFKWVPNGTPIGAFSNIGPTFEQRLTETEPTTFHVQIQYNYNYTNYQLVHAQVLGMLDSLGFNLNPAIIWNALPWSFVVDWVFGVSRWLDRFKVAALEPKINILRCLWSVKRRRRIQVLGTSAYYLNDVDPATPPASLARPTVVETAYRRSNFSMTGSLIESSGLSPTEISLGAALVLSRRRRPKPRRN